MIVGIRFWPMATHLVSRVPMRLVLVLLLTACTPAVSFAQTPSSELVDERVETFSRQGILGLFSAPFQNCTGEFEAQLLDAVFTRNWDAQRKSELLSLAVGMDWESCPSPIIDRWLVAQAPRESLSPLDSELIISAILNRKSPSQLNDFLEIGSNPSVPGGLRYRAFARAGRLMDIEGRVQLYVDWLEHPDVPLEYVSEEGIVLCAGSPSVLLNALSPGLLASLRPEVARRLTPAIRSIVSRANGASAEESARARQLLDDAAIVEVYEVPRGAEPYDVP